MLTALHSIRELLFKLFRKILCDSLISGKLNSYPPIPFQFQIEDAAATSQQKSITGGCPPPTGCNRQTELIHERETGVSLAANNIRYPGNPDWYSLHHLSSHPPVGVLEVSVCSWHRTRRTNLLEWRSGKEEIDSSNV